MDARSIPQKGDGGGQRNKPILTYNKMKVETSETEKQFTKPMSTCTKLPRVAKPKKLVL